jgi:hypothetical protein
MTSQTELETPRPKPTGRQLVFFKPNSNFGAVKEAFKKTTGIAAFNSRQFKGETKDIGNALTEGHAVYVERFRVAAV